MSAPAKRAAASPGRQNGHAPAAGLGFTRKTRWVPVPDYEGVASDEGEVTYEVELWSNYPQRLVDRIRSGDLAESELALGEIVLRHRLLVGGEDAGPWRDFDGAELPPPRDPAFWKAVPLDVAVALIRLVDEEPTRLPNFRPHGRGGPGGVAAGE